MDIWRAKMGLRLRFLSWWTPGWFQKKGLEQLAESTIKGLEDVIKSQDSLDKNFSLEKINNESDLHVKRKIMTQTHNELVERLIQTIGREKAIYYGRQSMFQEGLVLGHKFKKIMGVGMSIEDLTKAAKILYTVLGIDFTMQKDDNGQLTMVVNHCSLAEYYDVDTCKILSAADEGVVQGLNPNFEIKFTERITEGCSTCLAQIKVLKVGK